MLVCDASALRASSLDAPRRIALHVCGAEFEETGRIFPPPFSYTPYLLHLGKLLEQDKPK